MAQHKGRLSSSTQTVAKQVRTFRDRRGWSAEDLAVECGRLGAPELNRNVISNLESGRRGYVTLDELLVLAYALDVAPVHLLVPIDRRNDLDLDHYRVTPDVFLPPAGVRAWVRGFFCPPGRDPRRFFGNVPIEEHQQETVEMKEYAESLADLEEAAQELAGPGVKVDPNR